MTATPHPPHASPGPDSPHAPAGPSSPHAPTGLADRVAAALAAVPDPELPPVSITELGMLADVREQHGRVEVDLIPTFSGCPATELIARDVTAAVRALPGVREIEVRFVAEPAWSPERITPEGREKLREFGIAPPGQTAALVQLGDRPTPGTWPAQRADTAHGARRSRDAEPAHGAVACPLCGSHETVMDSPFGPTPCRSTHFCSTCRNPFEAIKP